MFEREKAIVAEDADLDESMRTTTKRLIGNMSE